MIATDSISLNTKGFSDVIDITGKVESIVKKTDIKNGLVTIFWSGSTGSITTIEYESGVINDRAMMFDYSEGCGRMGVRSYQGGQDEQRKKQTKAKCKEKTSAHPERKETGKKTKD